VARIDQRLRLIGEAIEGQQQEQRAEDFDVTRGIEKLDGAAQVEAIEIIAEMSGIMAGQPGKPTPERQAEIDEECRPLIERLYALLDEAGVKCPCP